MINFLFTKTPLLFLTQAIWRDEAFSYFMAKKNITEMFFLTAKDFNPPLYYFILHYWIKIFGGSEIALRSLSIIFFWMNIYVIFLFLSKVFKIKQRKAFLYMVLFIFNPLLLYYAFEARMYSMFAFFATLSYYSFYKKNNWLYLFSTVAGLFTHYFMFLVVLSQLFSIKIDKNKIIYVKNKIIYLSLLLFSPWLVLFLTQNKFPNSFWINSPHLKDIFVSIGIIYTGNESAFYSGALVEKIQKNVAYFSVILFAIIIAGIYLYIKKFLKKDQSNYLLLFIWGIGVPLVIFFISFIKPIYFPRYLIFTAVGLILLIVFILERLNVYLRSVLFALLIVLTFNYQLLQVEYRKKIDLRKTFNEIQATANKNDSVYTDDLDFFTAKYYLKNNNVYIYGKSYKEITAYSGKVLIDKENVAANLPLYPRKAFILKSDGQYVIQALF